jgi:hypothetical protein
VTWFLVNIGNKIDPLLMWISGGERRIPVIVCSPQDQ